MSSNTEVDLREASARRTRRAMSIKQRDLDAVGLLQRDGVERTSPSGRLAGEGLANLAETGVEQRQDRASGQFVDAPAPGGHVVQGSLVVALHQLDVGHARRSGWTSRATNSDVVLMTSASRNTTNSEFVAASPGAHRLALAARPIECRPRERRGGPRPSRCRPPSSRSRRRVRRRIRDGRGRRRGPRRRSRTRSWPARRPRRGRSPSELMPRARGRTRRGSASTGRRRCSPDRG